MDKNKLLDGRRTRRRYRVRNKMHGTAERPRLSISRSHKHIGCQVIDDDQGKTLCAISTLDAGLREQLKYGGNKAAAQAIGKAIAEKAIASGIKQVCFDRGHLRYHGRVAALADAAREAGLQF